MRGRETRPVEKGVMGQVSTLASRATERLSRAVPRDGRRLEVAVSTLSLVMVPKQAETLIQAKHSRRPRRGTT